MLLNGNDDYLRDMQMYYLIPGSFYLDLVQQFLRHPHRDECIRNATILLDNVDDVILQHTIASQLGMSKFLHRLFEKYDYLQDLLLL